MSLQTRTEGGRFGRVSDDRQGAVHRPRKTSPPGAREGNAAVDCLGLPQLNDQVR